MRRFAFWIVALLLAAAAGTAALYLPSFLAERTIEGLRSPYEHRPDPYFLARVSLLLGLGILLGAGLSRLPFLWGLQPLLLAFCAVIPFFISWGNMVAADFQKDPTSHNLLPFEILIIGALYGVPAAIGVYAGRVSVWLVKQVRKQNSAGDGGR